MYSTWRGMLYNKLIIDQVSSVKMAGYQPRSLFASLDLDTAQQDSLHMLQELCSALCNLHCN